MADKILADTSVWIEFFRGSSSTGEHLASLLQKKSVFTCGIVLFELLQGLRTEKEKIFIIETLQGLPYIEMTPSLWTRAAELSIGLRQKGLIIPYSDIFISSIAIEHKLSIFTLDKHFKLIPGVGLYKSK